MLEVRQLVLTMLQLGRLDRILFLVVSRRAPCMHFKLKVDRVLARGPRLYSL